MDLSLSYQYIDFPIEKSTNQYHNSGVVNVRSSRIELHVVFSSRLCNTYNAWVTLSQLKKHTITYPFIS